jgi:hypothetical protein
MALDPLATIADLEARGVSVDETETAVVGTYLAVASGLVREAAGTPISETVSTVTLEGRGSRLVLPGQPVTAVSAVSVDGVAVTDYRLMNGALTRPCGFHGVEVSVTYTHGFATVPADIVDLVCRLAAQTLLSFREGDPVGRTATSVRIGDYSVTYSDAETGTLTLSDFQRKRLASRFGSAVTTVRAL